MSKILLLEPDYLLGKIYSGVLENIGYKVEWCRNAQTAIHLSDSQSSDIIITELQLAGHNGIEFLYELRSYQDWQDIPAIVLSHVPPINLNQNTWRSLNVVAYLYKPQTKLKDILQTVDQVLVAG